MVEDTKETEHSLHDRADSRQQLLVTGRQRPAFRELGLDCKRRRGSAAGGGADELCGILLNCPSK